MPFLIITIIVIIALIVFALDKFRSPESKGKRGEDAVNREITFAGKGKQYVFKDYVLATDGKTVQIDHIVVNERGVFVIETKNYSGRIYGNEQSQEWTQVLAYGNVKNKFYNPIKQNATHVYYLIQILGKNVHVRPYVVFVNNNVENVQSDKVIALRDLKKVLTRGATVLTETQIEAIKTKLEQNNAREQVSDSEHVKNVHNQQDKIKKNICPRCNGKLVLRHGKYGDFWGCENYPKCKFIKK